MSEQTAPAPLLPIGTPAPEFQAVAGTGEAFSLSQFRGQWVLLAFYPFDFTGG